MNGKFALVILVALILTAVSVPGCADRSRSGDGWDDLASGSAAWIEDGVWPFAPTRFRIHPLTRVEPGEAGKYVIDARIEFFDQFGHNVKGLGAIRFELYPVGPGSRSARRTGRLAVWTIDLSDLEQNRRHYDDVTRTYLFRLQSDEEAAWPADLQLQATMIIGDERVTDAFTLARH